MTEPKIDTGGLLKNEPQNSLSKNKKNNLYHCKTHFLPDEVGNSV